MVHVSAAGPCRSQIAWHCSRESRNSNDLLCVMGLRCVARCCGLGANMARPSASKKGRAGGRRTAPTAHLRADSRETRHNLQHQARARRTAFVPQAPLFSRTTALPVSPVSVVHRVPGTVIGRGRCHSRPVSLPRSKNLHSILSLSVCISRRLQTRCGEGMCENHVAR